MTPIRNATILVLGGAGQVGFEFCSQILSKNPLKLIICDINEKKVKSAISRLNSKSRTTAKIGEWGDIFSDKPTAKSALIQIKSSIVELTNRTGVLAASDASDTFLYKLICKYKPDILVDAVNTATALAYKDSRESKTRESTQQNDLPEPVPIMQLIRHTQVLFQAFRKAQTKEYIKIGTGGTGGLGFTLPYTHGENEVPSKLLMSKSAVAGAQTMLLWVLARTPMMPIIKEIKVTALIGWREIGRGEFTIDSEPIALYDCPIEKSLTISDALKKHNSIRLNKNLHGTWIDTGENGIFTKDMFAAITSRNNMELITPAEIVKIIIDEIEGKHTGKDTISAMDNAVLGPTLIGSGMRQVAIDRMKDDDEVVASIPTLGPLTAKILWEAALLKTSFENIDQVIKENEKHISERTFEKISRDQTLRAKIISIGIPILLPSGKLLRGPTISIPDQSRVSSNLRDVETWAATGWVDLRPKNWLLWKTWLRDYRTSNNNSFNIGEICGWIFAHKLGGMRIKR